MCTVTVIIPARYASSRFPGKPLAQLKGRCMIEWVYRQAQQSRSTRQVVVATDDDRIAAAVQNFGGEVVMTSVDHRSGTDRVAEAAAQLGLPAQALVVNLQGDQPFFHPAGIDEVVAPLQENSREGMSTLIYRITNVAEISNPKDVKVTFTHDGRALYFSRASIPFNRDASAAVPVYKHLGVYACRRWFLDIFRNLPDSPLENCEKLEQLRALEYGHSIRVVLTEHDSPEVDIPEDIARLEKLPFESSAF